MKSNSSNSKNLTFDGAATYQPVRGHTALPAAITDGAYATPFQRVGPLQDIQAFQNLVQGPDRNGNDSTAPPEPPQGQEPPSSVATSAITGQATEAVGPPIPIHTVSGGGIPAQAMIEDDPGLPNEHGAGVAP